MAKRVNKRFLIILTSVLGVGLIGLFGLVVLHYRRHDPAKFVKQAEKAVAEHKYIEATGWYKAAIGSTKDSKGKAALFVKLGDVYDAAVVQDPNFLRNARGSWMAALENEPKYKPALDRLVSTYVEQMKLAGVADPGLYAALQDIAKRATDADPSDTNAQEWKHMAAIQEWLAGPAVMTKDVKDHLTALADLITKDPANPELPFYLARAKLKYATDLVTSGQRELAEPLFIEVTKTFDDLVAKNPSNGPMQLRAFQVYSLIAQVDPEQSRKDHATAAREASIDAAAQQTKPSEELFDDVQYVYTSWLKGQKKPRDVQERVFRDWVAKRPDDVRARLALAEFLGADPQTRPEAMKILQQGAPVDPSMHGERALVLRGYERKMLLDLTALRVEDVGTITRDEDRRAAIKQVDDNMTRIANMGFGDDFSYLKLRGRVEMLHNKPQDAVNTFVKARTVLGDNVTDPDLLNQLALAYAVTGQDGAARKTMEEVVAKAPQYVPGRLILADYYIRLGQFDDAAKQLDEVEKLDSQSPQLARLRIDLLRREKKTGDAKSEFARLPEKTRAERLNKGRAAAGLGDNAEAVRLFDSVRQENPADVEAVALLTQIYLNDNKRDQAKQVVAEALAKNPADVQLNNLKTALDANTPETVRQAQVQMAQSIAEPVRRAVQLARVEQAFGKQDALLQRLRDAEQQIADARANAKGDDRKLDELKANENQVLDMYYQMYVQQQKFDQAGQYVERLARGNADGADGLVYRTRFQLAKAAAATDGVEAQKEVQSGILFAKELTGPRFGEFATSWLLLGQCQQAANQFQEALKSYSQALQRQSTNIEALKGEALCYRALRLSDSERQVIEQAEKISPNSPDVRDLRINYEVRYGDPEKAVSMVQELLDKDPSNPQYYLAMGQACALSSEQKKATGDDAGAKKYMTTAQQVLAKGLERFKETPRGRDFYLPLADAQMRNGDAAGAQKLMVELTQRPEEKNRPEAFQQLADFYARAGDIPHAEEALRQAWDKSNHDPLIELTLAQHLVELRKFDEALRVLEANASDPRVVRMRMETLLMAGRADEAKVLIDRTIAANPNDSLAVYFHGYLMFEKNDLESAQRDFTTLRNRDPQNVNARLMLAKVLRARGDMNGAITELEVALQNAPLSKDIRGRLLEYYSAANPPSWANFDRAVQEAMADSRMKNDPTWPRAEAMALTQRGQYDDALKYMQQAMGMQVPPAQRDQLVGEYVNILLKKRDFPTVMQETDKLLAAGRRLWWVYEPRGMAEAGTGNPTAALKDFDLALAAADAANDPVAAQQVLVAIADEVNVNEALQRLATRPRQENRWRLLGVTFYTRKGDFARALQETDALLADPTKLNNLERVALLRSRAESYTLLSQPEKAKEAYAGALQIDPNDYQTLNNMAYLLAEKLNDPKSAKQYSEKAYQLVQRFGGPLPTVQDTHGWVLTLCGGADAKQGLSLLQRLVSDNNDFLEGRYHLGMALLKMGKTYEATDQFQQLNDLIADRDQNHRPVSADLRANVKKALDEAHQNQGGGLK